MAVDARSIDDGSTSAERAHRMAEEALRMGLAARREEETTTNEMINESDGNYRGGVCGASDSNMGHADCIGVQRYDLDNSVRYEGQWSNGYLDGLGVLRWENGGKGMDNGTIRYAGEWEADERHGLGVSWNEGGSLDYAGWWNKNLPSQTVPEDYRPRDGSRGLRMSWSEGQSFWINVEELQSDL
eukprot:GHVU01036519.1.p1 GENE.GHVU01036519.1~~GHVU01036519.1.p1  ORF type:complete len:185 (-),score=26.89 GHVU01036519.1:398-952(-)